MPREHDVTASDSRSSRRDFLRHSAALTAAALAAPRMAASFQAGGRDVVRVGLIGCGGRGKGAAANCVEADPAVRIHAIGDLFPDRLESCQRDLGKLGDPFDVGDRVFSGFDCFRSVLQTDVDLVILATPPGFRPIHLEAAVAAGKHVFMEKPVAVDPTGVRSVIASSEVARKKGLAIVSGTQRRHEESYLEVMRRIHDGAIGEVVGGQCYWNQGGLWHVDRTPEMSDVEWQIRNWLYLDWLSGDHIVEQHIHNIDVMNWALAGPPVKAVGLGGRQVRTEAHFGHIFDHFAIEYEYANGARVASYCRQIKGTPSRVGEHLVGTKGIANPGGWIRGATPYQHKNQGATGPYVQEHVDLIASIRAGAPLNEGRRVAESTLTAIMGRMSAYTGQEVTWDFAMSSKLDLMPAALAFGDRPVPPVPMPGMTPLI